MDDFVKATARTIGHGGLKCPCCNDFRTFGNNAKQLFGLNKLRRSRCKAQLKKELQKLQEIMEA